MRAVGASREESHALFTPVDEEAEGAAYVPIPRGSITVHNERVVHGSGPNLSSGWRKVGQRRAARRQPPACSAAGQPPSPLELCGLRELYSSAL